MSHDLLQAYRAGSEDAADGLVRQHLGLVRRVVGRLNLSLPPSLDQDDLIEVGILGLLHAARSWDPTRGASFRTFAYIAIRGAVLDELRRVDVLPRARRDALRSYDAAQRELADELGREPTFFETQERLGLQGPELEEVLRSRTLAQVQRAGEACSGVSPDTVHGEGGDPLEIAQQREAMERLADVMASLPEREQQVLILYYRGNLLLREIGRVLGLTESRVSQILHHALLVLNQRMGQHREEQP